LVGIEPEKDSQICRMDLEEASGNSLQDDLKNLLSELRGYLLSLNFDDRIELETVWGIDFDFQNQSQNQKRSKRDVLISQKSTLNVVVQSTSKNQNESSYQQLLEELGNVRKEVRIAYDQLNSTFNGEDLDNTQNMSRQQQLVKQALLYLFFKDLSSLVCGEVLDYKEKRDAVKANRVSIFAKVLGWSFVLVLNFVLLLYVYLFAMRQTRSRQSAWFISFLMWLLFEVFISSTGLVLICHILIPLYVFSDVKKIKDKIMRDLVFFRNKFRNRDRNSSIHSRNTTESEVGKIKMVVNLSEGAPEEKKDFNSAKYLFASWRLSWLLVNNHSFVQTNARAEVGSEISEMILGFKTPWPKKSLKQSKSSVSREYDEAILLTALSRVLMFIVMKLFEMPVMVLDSVVQMMWNGGMGSLMLLMIRLYEVNEYLPLVIVGAILLICMMVMTQEKRFEFH
jgi:hypothetical protein